MINKNDLLKKIHTIIKMYGTYDEIDKNKQFVIFNDKRWIIFCGKFMMFSDKEKIKYMKSMSELSEDELSDFINHYNNI